MTTIRSRESWVTMSAAMRESPSFPRAVIAAGVYTALLRGTVGDVVFISAAKSYIPHNAIQQVQPWL